MSDFSIGPCDGVLARAWLASARRILGWIRDDPELAAEFPADVGAGFDSLLADWEEVATGETFQWSRRMNPDDLRHLLAYWHLTASIVMSRVSDPDTPLPPPETEPFRAAVIEAATAAVEQSDDPSAFAPAFRSMWEMPGQAPATTSASISVMVVDDDEDIRLLLRSALSVDSRFDVVGEAEDGQAAVDACVDDCPDVIVLDLNMPRLDGFRAIPLLRDSCPGATIVVYTANANIAEVATSLKERGAHHIVPKGKPLRELLALLASVA